MQCILRMLSALVLLLLAGPTRAEDLLIRAAKVYTKTGPPLAPGAVLISGGKIAQVGPALTAPAGVRVIDLGSGTLLPGLIDAYSHAGIAVNSSEITKQVTPEYRVQTDIDCGLRG